MSIRIHVVLKGKLNTILIDVMIKHGDIIADDETKIEGAAEEEKIC